MTTITSAILEFIFGILDKILPVLDLPPNFISSLDTATSFFVGLIQSVCFFIPLDILVLCFSTMMVADNFTLITRLIQFIIKLIRG